MTCQRVVSVPTETSTGEADGLDPGHPTKDPGASSLPHHCRQRFVPSVGHQVTRALAQLQGEEPSVTLSGVLHFTFSYFLPVHSANLEWTCRFVGSPQRVREPDPADIPAAFPFPLLPAAARHPRSDASPFPSRARVFIASSSSSSIGHVSLSPLLFDPNLAGSKVVSLASLLPVHLHPPSNPISGGEQEIPPKLHLAATMRQFERDKPTRTYNTARLLPELLYKHAL